MVNFDDKETIKIADQTKMSQLHQLTEITRIFLEISNCGSVKINDTPSRSKNGM